MAAYINIYYVKSSLTALGNFFWPSGVVVGLFEYLVKPEKAVLQYI
jgi:hypothetical protein